MINIDSILSVIKVQGGDWWIALVLFIIILFISIFKSFLSALWYKLKLMFASLIFNVKLLFSDDEEDEDEDGKPFRGE